jgi:hypothetical protein
VEDSFGTVMEFSVALAGFSAVAIALSHEPGSLAPLDRFRALNLLSTSLGPAFGASFVLIGASFGMSDAPLWRFASSGVLIVAVLNLFVPILLRRRLSSVDRGRLSRILWALAVGGNPLLVVVQLANIFGLFGPPSAGPIMASLIWLLLFSSLLFVRMLVQRPVPPAA